MKGPLADDKALCGKGRLTDKVINKLKIFLGIAIRQSTENTVYQLKKSIGAEAADLENRYQMCPRTAHSCFKYQADKLHNRNTYKEKGGIPDIISETIRPVFI